MVPAYFIEETLQDFFLHIAWISTWIKPIGSKHQILDQMKRAKMCGKLIMICLTY